MMMMMMMIIIVLTILMMMLMMIVINDDNYYDDVNSTMSFIHHPTFKNLRVYMQTQVLFDVWDV
jgi:ABC-type cobalt transport system substrate-binding protein